MTAGLIDFDMIESQKENIGPSQGGHSAAALARTFNKDPLTVRGDQAHKRAVFEQQIAESEELDDPIQPYLDYIKYINEVYPQGHTAENGLVQVLERCTSQFRDAPYYKDDSRYLKVWIQYAKYSDAPKELYTYLCRKEIGRNLSLFYEEFAAYLESVDRKSQAREVYLAGINLNARPIERLRRRYQEFCQRLEVSPPSENEPKSPTFAPVRAALAVKDTTGSDLSSSSSSFRPESMSSKVSVFQDSSSTYEKTPADSGSAWDMFGTMSQRRKENVMEAKPWEGERLPMDPEYRKKPVKSMSIFRDPIVSGSNTTDSNTSQLSSSHKREERMAVAIQFLVDENGDEYCLEEVLARSRRLLDKSYPRPFSQSQDINVYSEPLKVKAPASPTMTFHTKAATDEIYEMFNQPLKDEEDDSDSTDYSDNSNDSNDQEDESLPDYSYEQDNEEEREEELGMSDLTQNTGQLSVNSRPVSQELSNTTFTPVREQKHDIRALSTMTPISETSEAPSQNPEVVRKEIINPMDFGVRQKILLSSSQRSFLESQHKFFYYDMKFEMEQKLKRTILQANRNQAPSNALITFPNGYPSFKFLKIIGEGGFGSVFLVESQDNFLKACKVERTKLPWEYYMLKKVEGRLKDTRALESIMTIDEIHSFEDEQYLFQQFLPYGTMIDAVNYWKEEHEGKSFDELTAMYFTVEILRSMETLHSNGIIHGDIKPDNFMIRYDSSITLENRNYNRLGQAGWDSQGIKLIDFGRAIDMKLFPSDVQFIANWKMDQQDCVEMQKQQTWTYQADYHGIAAIIYLMLFGEFIKLAEDREGNVSVFRISNSLKRYWQKDIWNELFTILLNSALVAEQSEVKLPLTPLLSSCREKFEDYLEQHSEGGNSSLYDSLNWLHEGLAKRFKHISNDLF